VSTTEVGGGDGSGVERVPQVDLRLEVVVIPVSDVDRAKAFYEDLGWRLDAASSSPLLRRGLTRVMATTFSRVRAVLSSRSYGTARKRSIIALT
jgi:predicted lactoylglutathione lyase